MSIDNLFTPLQLGKMTLPNRIVMPPLTRMRAPLGVPTALSVEYYAQRASAGLVIAEATAISPDAHGYPDMPGIYTDAQIEGWREVTAAVHDKGGRIVMQLVHSGRASHSLYNADRALPIAPSAIAPGTGQAFTPSFSLVDFETPRALRTDEIAGITTSFRQAAVNAMAAGFDGVELHSANGYLLDQFLQDGSNHREDSYGGSVAGRAKFLLETVEAVVNAIGPDSVGVRLSPHGNFNDMHDSDPIALFSYLIEQLNSFGLAYLAFIEPRSSSIGLGDDLSVDSANNVQLFRRLFNGPVLSAGGYTAETASEAILAGNADAIGFGRAFIANPDLVDRLMSGATLNKHDRSTFYGGAKAGYTDYPLLERQVEAQD